MVLLPLSAVYLLIHAFYLGKDICAGTCTADSVTSVMVYLVPGIFIVAELPDKNHNMNNEWNCGKSAIGLVLWQWFFDLF
jgi:hypothetical protein